MILRDFLIYFATYMGLFLACFYLLSLRSYKRELKKIPDSELPSVTIIIPAFNEEKGIATSIKSASNINYPGDRFEIIVVDDGSKDRTFEIASKFKSKIIKVFKLPKNSGKGYAMNFAIAKSKGDIIVTMDADNVVVGPEILKELMPFFYNEKVMCVTPSMGIHNPKGILQRVQQVEYMFGIFLREALSSFNAVHITPGAFSVYRKKFFEKYGGFDEKNITEDMEMAFRIQFNHYILANNSKAVVYVVAPNKFVTLMKQRRRWYSGLVKNLWKYKQMFSRKYGILGTLVLPVVVISIFLSIALVSVMVTDLIISIKDELILWNSVNFDFINSFQLSEYVIQKYVFLFISNPVLIFSSILLLIFLGYMIFAKNKLKKYDNIKLSIFLFLGLYSLLYAFWWIVSLGYVLLNRKVSWR